MRKLHGDRHVSNPAEEGAEFGRYKVSCLAMYDTNSFLMAHVHRPIRPRQLRGLAGYHSPSLR